MNVSIVIPNYNGEVLLKKNLPKVFEAASYYSQKTDKTVEIIVIDDGSTDDSVISIKNYQTEIKNIKIHFKIIENEKNLGFSSTVNRAAAESNGDILVLLNTDVIPEKDFLIPLLSHFVDEKVFAVGCMDKSIENGHITLRGRGIGRFERGFLFHARGEIDSTNTLWVSGGSAAFRKTIWVTLNGFNKLYNPFYYEDIDLSYRALKSGYSVLFEPKSVVVHEHETGAIKTNYSANEVKVVAYKNQFIFVWLNITDINLILKHIAWLPYHFLFTLYKKEITFWIGFLKAIILLPSILSARSQNKKMFTKEDKTILQNFSKKSLSM